MTKNTYTIYTMNDIGKNSDCIFPNAELITHGSFTGGFLVTDHAGDDLIFEKDELKSFVLNREGDDQKFIDGMKQLANDPYDVCKALSIITEIPMGNISRMLKYLQLAAKDQDVPATELSDEIFESEDFKAYTDLNLNTRK